MGFRKLGHCKPDEMERLKQVKVKISVLSFITELAMQYDNEKQLLICQIELERYKLLHENILEQIYKRTGFFPGRGQVEIFRSGDIMEYY